MKADKPVAAICHGVLPLALSGALKGRSTTTVPPKIETLSHLATTYIAGMEGCVLVLHSSTSLRNHDDVLAFYVL